MRKIWDIPGGIHPPENKLQSLGEGIGQLPMPERLVLPLNQHIGAPARPLVAVGDRVLKGQLIAEAAGPVSATIHAPTSGTVVAVGDHAIPHPSGMSAPCITVAPDGLDTWIHHQGVDDYLEAPAETLLQRVRDAGITGMGGAGFPTAVKLAPRHPIDTLILNGTECEPYITADDVLMQYRAGEIVEGARILARLLGNPATVLIGVEDNKPQAFEALTQAAAGTPIEVVEFPTKYPSGGEKQLIQILTGREVPSGKLPADLGIVCQNVGTAQAVYRAVALGQPLISRITTVTGKACAVNRNYEVLLGTPVSHLLLHSGFHGKDCTRLVMGGPMMGFTLLATDVPVIKTTNCILACNDEESPRVPPPQLPCIRCGMCAEACPASLLPQQLYWYSQAEDYDRVQAYNLFDCIECGACAYVCPSNIPLVQYYRAAKGEIRKLEAEKRKSDHARERFEFHKARLERAEAEKAAKREARKVAAQEAQGKEAAQHGERAVASPVAAAGTADDLIQAAMARAAAKAASPEHQRGKLERGLEAARHRLQFAEDKLREGSDQGVGQEQLDKLQVQVEEARRKLQDAERKLAEFRPAPAATEPAADVAARIATKIQASPREQLESKITSLQQRIATTEAKIAEEADESVKTALISGLDKQREKLTDAQQQLQLLGDSGTAPAADPIAMDAAAAAIARAQAKARALAEMTPTQKLDADIEALVNRVDKARSKLEKAREEGSEHIDTLAGALEKLENKLAEARRERQQLAATAGERQS